jgi:uncharacterized membrane protein YphA (DoxX/SURF4 family)
MQTTKGPTVSNTPPLDTAESTTRDREPSILATFATRALALYFFAYFLSGQVGDRALPGVLRYIAYVGAPLEWLDDHTGRWLGAHVFGVTRLIGGGPGAGDGPAEWLRTFWFAAAALIVAGVWTAIRPRSRNPQRGREWFRAFLRYPLAFTMIEYGVMKFARTQFGVLPLQQQMTPLGAFSPSALMWAFMSYSYPYRVFTGMAEVLGGTLLLWRRTTTLGALIVFGVMSNVLAMNLSYDVSVKLLAGHLVLMSVILFAPDAARLIRVFALNRATTPVLLPQLVSDPRRSRRLGYVGAAYVAYAVGTVVWDNVSLGARAHSGQPAPVTGLYDVESISRNGVAIGRASDPSRWNRVAIESTGFMKIQFPDERTECFLTGADSANRRLTLIHSSELRDPRFDYRNYYIPFTKAMTDAVPATDTGRFVLAMEQPDRAHVRLSGRLRGDSIDVVLRRFDESRRLLTNWGSHLVNRLNFSDTWIVAPYSGWPVDSLSRSRR